LQLNIQLLEPTQAFFLIAFIYIEFIQAAEKLLMSKLPVLTGMIRQLIATPSVSSVSPKFDQSNLHVISLLANWCDTLGFNTEIQTINEHKKAD
jgi:hypothetical protein